MITLQLADKKGLQWAQEQVMQFHYLHHPVDPRCSPVAYIVRLGEEPVGCLIFGRPESTKFNGWYGSVADMRSGKCRLSRWEILNLARVYLDPRIQRGNVWCTPELLPGFVDRKGIWHSRAASYIIEQSLALIVFDFLMLRPPVWVEEPFAIREILSYCNTHLHKGMLYRAAQFRLIRVNQAGVATYARAVRPLTQSEQAQIVRRSEVSERCRRLRSQRHVAQYHQLTWEGL